VLPTNSLAIQNSSVLDLGSIPNWVMPVVALVGILWNIRLILPNLKVSILDIGIQRVHQDMALVLVHLSFENPSSLSKSVGSLQPKSTTDNIVLQLVPRVYHQGLAEVAYRLPSDDYQFRLPTSESLQIPFHIPPHQCLHKWIAVLLKSPDLQKHTPDFYFEIFRSSDRKGKISSTSPVQIEQKPIII